MYRKNLLLLLAVATMFLNVNCQSDICVDVDGWSNGQGWDCDGYKAKGWCKDGGAASKEMEWTLGSKYNNPEMNCCVCGKGKGLYSYRVSNNGPTTWRPTVSDVEAYSDFTCDTKIAATYVQVSGHHESEADAGGQNAFDGVASTSWRPQCHPCSASAAWVVFSTTAPVRCVTASNLGQGAGGDNHWDGGIVVETKDDDNTWTTSMSSSSGNSAVTGEVCLTSNGKECVFPFTYGDVEYHGCTSEGSGSPWCFITVVEGGAYTASDWGYCGAAEACKTGNTYKEHEGHCLNGDNTDPDNTLYDGTFTAEECLDYCRKEGRHACEYYTEGKSCSHAQSAAKGSGNNGYVCNVISTENCYSRDSTIYRGSTNHFISDDDTMHNCKDWATITNNGGLSGNQCRDPEKLGKPWCWSASDDAVRGYCDIPKCELDCSRVFDLGEITYTRTVAEKSFNLKTHTGCGFIRKGGCAEYATYNIGGWKAVATNDACRKHCETVGGTTNFINANAGDSCGCYSEGAIEGCTRGQQLDQYTHHYIKSCSQVYDFTEAKCAVKDRNIGGSDLVNTGVDSAGWDECIEKCKVHPECTSISFESIKVYYNKNRCHLKTATPDLTDPSNTVEDTNIWSAVMDCGEVPKCYMDSDDTSVTFKMNECGTNDSVDGSKKKFSNKLLEGGDSLLHLTDSEGVSVEISITERRAIDLTCEVETKKTTANDVKFSGVLSTVTVDKESGEAMTTLTFEVYDSSDDKTVDSAPYSVNVGDDVYFRISWSVLDDAWKVAVEYIKAAGDGKELTIRDSTCGTAFSYEIIPSGDTKRINFKLKAFHFGESDVEISITTHLLICPKDDACLPACPTKKRSVEMDDDQYRASMTQGPFLFHDNEHESAAQSVTTAFSFILLSVLRFM